MESSDEKLLAQLGDAIRAYMEVIDRPYALERRLAKCLRMQMTLRMTEVFNASANESLHCRLRELVQRVIDEANDVDKKVEAAYRFVIRLGLYMDRKTDDEVEAHFSEEDEIGAEIQQIYNRTFGSRHDLFNGHKDA
jgi:hypothetical protein